MRRNPTALLVSGEASLIEAVREAIDSLGDLDLVVAPGPSEAHRDVARDNGALVLVHQDCVGDFDEVIRLVRSFVETKRSLPVIVLSNRHRPEQVLELLRLGVADCLCRPLDLSRLTYLIDILSLRARRCPVGLVRAVASESATRTGPARGDPNANTNAIANATHGHECGAACLERLMEQIVRVAALEATILLGGETGTGKTRLARLIHELSPRRHLPFLVVNCGALSATLIESELFGHVKGAFTGADRDHVGKFAEVGRGTLLLDEIDALPPPLQAKLLRAVEERVFEPVGSNRSLPVQARLIAASNRPLDEEAAASRFRSDLYYRLNVISFTLPPLRGRRETIPALAREFLAEIAARSGREVFAISVDALRAMQAYEWPGNIRELRNVIERAVALSVSLEIELEDLPEPLQRKATASGFADADARRAAAAPWAALRAAVLHAPAPSFPSTLARTKDDAERFRITDALQRHANNRLRAAAELGISRMTLYKKLHKYGLMGSA
jgi:DNA-binding NtrC family response regulator